LDCTKARDDDQAVCSVQKDCGEIVAKVLFDLLMVHIFKSTSGEFFDAEAYTSPNDQINTYWKPLVERTKKKELDADDRSELIQYVNVSLVLTQLQTVRFLDKPLVYKGTTILSWPAFKLFWRGKRFSRLQRDAEHFAASTVIKATSEDPRSQLTLHRLKDIVSLTQVIDEETNPAQIHQLNLMRQSYYPEAYYTNGAYLQVCYSDDPNSQAFVTAATRELTQGHSILTHEDLAAIRRTEGLVALPSFEYAISIAENLAYAIHKLKEGEDNPQDSLFIRFLNASKYLLRVARGLEGYAKTNPGVVDVRHLKKLSDFSFQLERLKRGFPPFTSVKEIKHFLDTAFKTLEQASSKLDAGYYAEELCKIAFDLWATPEVKISKIRNMNFPISKFVIELRKDKPGRKWFLVESRLIASAFKNDTSRQKAEAASRVALLLNYISGLETHRNEVMKRATKAEQVQLEETLKVPFLNGGKTLSDLKSTKAQADAFKTFVNGLIQMVHDVIQDLERKNGNYQSTGLGIRLEQVREITERG